MSDSIANSKTPTQTSNQNPQRNDNSSQEFPKVTRLDFNFKTLKVRTKNDTQVSTLSPNNKSMLGKVKETLQTFWKKPDESAIHRKTILNFIEKIRHGGEKYKSDLENLMKGDAYGLYNIALMFEGVSKNKQFKNNRNEFEERYGNVEVAIKRLSKLTIVPLELPKATADLPSKKAEIIAMQAESVGKIHTLVNNIRELITGIPMTEAEPGGIPMTEETRGDLYNALNLILQGAIANHFNLHTVNAAVEKVGNFIAKYGLKEEWWLDSISQMRAQYGHLRTELVQLDTLTKLDTATKRTTAQAPVIGRYAGTQGAVSRVNSDGMTSTVSYEKQSEATSKTENKYKSKDGKEHVIYDDEF